MSGYPMIDALNATNPLTPREKVELKPCPFCGGDAVAGSNFDNDHYVMCGADCDKCGGMVGYMKTETAAIENWNRRTALASGSGDHAELARLAEAASAPIPTKGSGKRGEWHHAKRLFHAAANPAAVLALLAENAALRAQVMISDADAGDITATNADLSARHAEAERKLAEAVGLLREAADGHPLSVNWGRIDEWLSKEAERG